MKKLFGLIISCVIFSSCYTPAERSAIEACKHLCKYENSFRLDKIESSWTVDKEEWCYDTIYYYKGEERLRKEHDHDFKNWDGYCSKYVDDPYYTLVGYYPKMVEYDSLTIVKIGHNEYKYLSISITFFAKNAFGMESKEFAFYHADNENSKSYSGFPHKSDTIIVYSEKFKNSKRIENNKHGYYVIVE